MSPNFFFAIFALLGGIFLFVLGLFTFLKAKDRKVGITFGLFCWSVTVWLVMTFFVFIAKTDPEAIFWDRNVYLGVILIPLFMYQFGVYFLGMQKRQKIILWLGYFASLVFLAISRMDFFLSGLYRYEWGVHTRAQIFHSFFLLYFFLIIGFYFYNLYQGYKVASGERKIQLKYLFVAFLVLNSGGIAYLPAYGINFYPIFAYFAEILGAIILFFVIFKHQLFNFKVFLAEAVIVIMAIVLLTIPFFVETAFLKFLTALVFIVYCILGYLVAYSFETESKRREEAEMVAMRERVLRQEAEELAANLKHLNQAKNQFLLSTQHHLRSPLSVVQGYLSMIGEGNYGKIPVKAREKIDASLAATKKLVGIVDELLDVAHFQMNKGLVEKHPIDAVSLISGIVSDLKEAAAGKKIFLKFDRPGLPVPMVDLDPKGMREAIYNIVDNAIKYTNEGGVTVSLAVVGKNLVVTVVDTGIGMDEGERRNVFNRTFERGKKAKEVNADGKGIGLYLAAQMVIGNGGTIRVESEGRGKGSKFIVELPMRANSAEIAPAALNQSK
ncbi:MAG: ATP-binding protein [Candidatus Pacebacteria bacterium]|jgi:signal transduction histidine kinase|nr:ATP-binding protein [Candidatus Paceibacterota bacterium]